MSDSAHAVRRVSTAIDFMETHLSEKLTLDKVANAVFCSKYHFHRLFVKTMGMTACDYLQRRRLTEAARALIHSEMPILHIALGAGYESQQGFTTVFKSMYKRPPREFRCRAVFYPLQLPPEFGGDSELVRAGEPPSGVRSATAMDTPAWMRLVRLVVDGFSCLHEGEYLEALRDRIARGQAHIIKDGALAVGAMMFSPETGSIEFMGIHPLYRNAGVAEALLDHLRSLPSRRWREISTTSYRAGDKADTGHRKALKNLGFVEAELLTEFGYPTQKFLLRNHSHPRKRKR